MSCNKVAGPTSCPHFGAELRNTYERAYLARSLQLKAYTALRSACRQHAIYSAAEIAAQGGTYWLGLAEGLELALRALDSDKAAKVRKVCTAVAIHLKVQI